MFIRKSYVNVEQAGTLSNELSPEIRKSPFLGIYELNSSELKVTKRNIHITKV